MVPRYFALLTTLAISPALAEQAVELRAGTLVPAQVLDGANVHTALGWRLALGDATFLRAETGLDRTAVTGLTAQVETLGGSVVLRADHQLWTVPALVGVGWEAGDLGLTLLGGAAYAYAATSAQVVDGATLLDEDEHLIEPMVRGRADARWPLPAGELLIGAGWQHVFVGERSTGEVHASGLILEVGWRAQL